MKFGVEKCEVLVNEVAEHNLVSDIKLDIPKFDTHLPYFTQTGGTYDENQILKPNSNKHQTCCFVGQKHKKTS